MLFRTAILLLLPFFLTAQNYQEELAKEWMKQANIGFEENKGQFANKEILFKASAKGLNIYITKKGLSYVFHKNERVHPKPSEDKTRRFDWERTDMLLRKAKIHPKNIVREELLEQGYINYFTAANPQGVTGVKTYRKITIKEIYPGIDWVLYASSQGLKYDFVVHPGADPNQIQLQYKGTSELSLDDTGKRLQLSNGIGNLSEGKLFCYQTINDQRSTVNAAYTLKGNTIIFKLAHYQIDQLLIIDPPMELKWATFYGGDNIDGPEIMDIDNAGNVYISGYTGSADLPLQASGGAYYSGTLLGNNDVFIVKFDNNGVRQWATLYGGSSTDNGKSICTDNNGNVFITGSTRSTSNDLPIANPGGGAYTQGSGGLNDAYIAKFDNAGAMVWSTYYGGSGGDGGESVCTDANGNIFISGYSRSNNLPVLNGGGGNYYQGTRNGTAMNNDAFVVKFNNNGVRQWATYYGGSGSERAGMICTDPNGNVYFTGRTRSDDFPLMNPGGGAHYEGTLGNAVGTTGDGFLVKFNNNGVRQWATYYGGDADDEGYGVHADNTFIYLVGLSRSSDLFTQNPGGGAYFQGANASTATWADAFIAKFLHSGVPIWATYLGGSLEDFAKSVTTDANGEVYVVGEAWSNDFPTMNAGAPYFFQGTSNGNDELFILNFDNAGVELWGTLYGGIGADWAEDVLIDDEGCLWVTGEYAVQPPATTATINTLDMGSGAWYQSTNAGQDDGCMMKFCSDQTQLTITVSGTDPACYGDSTGTVSVVANGTPNYTYDWQPINANTATVNNLPAGTYTVTVTDADNNTKVDSVTITEPDELSIDPMTDISICPGDIATLSAVVNGGSPTYIYTWDGSQNGNNIQVSPSDTTRYNLVVTDSENCQDTASVLVIIVPEVIAQVNADTSFCLGESYQLSASGGSTYSWSPTTGLSDPNIAAPVATPSATTTYQVIVSSGSCPEDTTEVTITVTPIQGLVSGNATICIGDSVALSASGGSTYNWIPTTDIDDATSPTPMVFPPTTTTYSVIVSDGNCTPDTAAVTVTVVPSINAGISEDTVICEGQSVALTASGGTSYSWGPETGLSDTVGSTVVAAPVTSTTYTVTVKSGACTPATSTILVDVLPAPNVNAGTDTIITPGQSITLNASGGNSYTWSPAATLSDSSSPVPTATPTTNITYTVVIKDENGCTDTAYVTITLQEECERTDKDLIYIPSAFSPNGDGVNDVFKVHVLEGCVEIIRFIVYDRWGEKVFETNADDGWDGTYRNNIMNTAVFDYYLEGLLYDGETVIRSGSVSLIR